MIAEWEHTTAPMRVLLLMPTTTTTTTIVRILMPWLVIVVEKPVPRSF
jgi:hypothetical protein